MDIKINIQCPCCESPIDPKEHRGVIINKARSLGAQLITLREQMDRLEKQKPSNNKSKMDLEGAKAILKGQIAGAEHQHRIFTALENS